MDIVKVFGGSSVMTHAREEAADMTSIADAVVINIDTLDNNHTRSNAASYVCR
ncbi:hypothetical protein AGMMS50222_09510 [Endomicrobiia bacterium]|nr:hypothetical protein AGMMS49556_09810 [Endomicrobiia bacterium]GHT76640.1 hypothetical protein AGMMS50222_09510 [Endomicrobiia bacterium]GHU49882.1 hypothetical protein AGMMS50289_26820 [Betaproteobacteria bacterium]